MKNRYLFVFALVLSASLQPAAAGMVQFVHVAPYDADHSQTEVRLRLNRLYLNETIKYGETSVARFVPNASIELSFFDVDSGRRLLFESHTFDAEFAWVFLMGNGTTEDFRIKVVDSKVQSVAGEGVPLRFLHAAPSDQLEPVAWRHADGTLVADGVQSSSRNLDDLQFGSIVELALPAGEYDMKFTTPLGDQTLIESVRITLDEDIDPLAGEFPHIVLVGDGVHQPLGVLNIRGGMINDGDEIDNSSLGWWDATSTAASEGLLIQPLPDEERMVGTIYTYTEDGSGAPAWYTFDTCDNQPGEDGCRHLSGFSGRQALAGVYASSGGQLGGDSPSTLERVGTLLLVFDSCDHGVAHLALDNGTEVDWEIQRLTRTVDCSWGSVAVE